MANGLTLTNIGRGGALRFEDPSGQVVEDPDLGGGGVIPPSLGPDISGLDIPGGFGVGREGHILALAQQQGVSVDEATSAFDQSLAEVRQPARPAQAGRGGAPSSLQEREAERQRIIKKGMQADFSTKVINQALTIKGLDRKSLDASRKRIEDAKKGAAARTKDARDFAFKTRQQEFKESEATARRERGTPEQKAKDRIAQAEAILGRKLTKEEKGRLAIQDPFGTLGPADEDPTGQPTAGADPAVSSRVQELIDRGISREAIAEQLRGRGVEPGLYGL